MKSPIFTGSLLLATLLVAPIAGASPADAIPGRVVQAQVKSLSTKLIGFRSFGYIGGFAQSAGPNGFSGYTFYKTATYDGFIDGSDAGFGPNTSETIHGAITLGPGGGLTLPRSVQFGYYFSQNSAYHNPAFVTEQIPASVVGNSVEYTYIRNGVTRDHFLSEPDSAFLPTSTFSAAYNSETGQNEVVYRALLALPLTPSASSNFIFGTQSSGSFTPELDSMLNITSDTDLDGLVAQQGQVTPANDITVVLSDPDDLASVLARNPESGWQISTFTGLNVDQADYSTGVRVLDRDVSAQRVSIRVGFEQGSCGCSGAGQYLVYLGVNRFEPESFEAVKITKVVPVTIDASGVSQEDIDLPFDTTFHYELAEIRLERVQDCEACDAQANAAGFGPGAREGSVDFDIRLASANSIVSPAIVHLYADHITSDLYHLDALQILQSRGDVTTHQIKVAGQLRQIAYPGGLLDAVVTGPESYELRLYLAAQIGSVQPDDTFAVSGTPYLAWAVGNPGTSSPDIHRLRIAKVTASKTIETLYTENSVTGEWEISEGNGLRVVTHEVQVDSPEERVLLATIKNSAGSVKARHQLRYLPSGIGWTKVSETNDPEGRNLLRSFDSVSQPYFKTVNIDQAAATYSIDHFLSSLSGQLESTEAIYSSAFSLFTRYVHDTTGDIDGDGLPEPMLRTIALLGAPHREGGGEADLRPGKGVSERSPDRVAMSSPLPAGLPTVNMEHDEEDPPVGGAAPHPLITEQYKIEFTKVLGPVQGSSYRILQSIIMAPAATGLSDPANLITTERVFDGGPFAEQLSYRLTPDQILTTVQLTLDSLTGTVTKVERIGAPSGDLETVVDGTETTTVTDSHHVALSTVTKDIVSGIVMDSAIVSVSDALGRPIATQYLDGSTEQLTYNDYTGQVETRSRHGLTTVNSYDDLGRLSLTTQHTTGGINLGGTRLVYDAADRVVATYRVGSDGSEKLQESTTYDVAGYAVERKDALNRTTSIAEDFPTIDQLGRQGDDGVPRRMTTTTFPDGGVQVQKIFNGGFMAEISGTAVSSPRTFAYGSDELGRTFDTQRATGTGESRTTSYNSMGQMVSVRFADNAEQTSSYDLLGRLVQTIDPDGVSTLYAYNARGERTTVAVDTDRDGNLDLAGDDRVTQTLLDYVSDHGTQVRRTRIGVWHQSGTDAAHEFSLLEESTDGLNTWRTIEGVTTATAITYDGVGGRTETVTNPDGSLNVRRFVGDRLISDAASATGTTLDSQIYDYDVYSRVSSVTDARAGATYYTYFVDDKVHTVTTPDPDISRSGSGYDAQTTTYAYDESGRISQVTSPDGGSVNTTYYPAGQVKRTWGTRTYPVEYAYDAQGRVQTLTTWQDFAGDSGRAVTTWQYDSVRGWLAAKVDDSNQSIGYTYTPAGRMASRTWARGVTTTYDYNNVGDVSGISYSDDTPAVSMTYDRLGRVDTKTDGTGTCTYTYLDATSLVLDEVHSSGLLAGVSVARGYDSLKRIDSLSATPIATMAYAYDAASRLHSVTSGANTATYAYVANSSLIGSVALAANGTVRLTTTRTYDRLERLAAISNQPSASGAAALSYAYTYNAANQRTRATRADGSYWQYTYDALGQITAGNKFLADGTPALGAGYDYTYDDIGNRKTTSVNGQAASYTSNRLNQYTQRTVPGVIDVVGAATPAATVTIAVGADVPLATTRQAGAFYRQIAVDNSAVAQVRALKITGVKNLAGPNGEDAVTELTRTAFVAPAMETLAYDGDGNLTDDARWHYSWDGENRLKVMETAAAAVTAGMARQKLEFAYDALGRRIAKKVSTWNGSAWTLGSATSMVYDNWNLIVERDALAANVAIRTYAWGLDVSGSQEGAGGVGGLLFADLPATAGSGSATQYYAFDGNGNVAGLVSAVDGTRTANYDYNAFGETVVLDGSFATANPFRFSTKYTDTETGHLYYGYRCYAPQLGRWLSRDPIAESGGINMYAIVRNSPTNAIDPFGRNEIDVHQFLTDYIARAAGFSTTDARAIGESTQSLDAPGSTRDAMYHGVNWKNMKDYHFVDQERLEVLQNAAMSEKRIGGNAAGEYFHALEDTYPHSTGVGDRNWIYRGGDHGGLVGHAKDGHSADWTWKDVEKSMKEAKELYDQMVDYAKAHGIDPCKAKPWEEIQKEVLKFVSYQPSLRGWPIKSVTFEGYSEKIKLLDPSYALPEQYRKIFPKENR